MPFHEEVKFHDLIDVKSGDDVIVFKGWRGERVLRKTIETIEADRLTTTDGNVYEVPSGWSIDGQSGRARIADRSFPEDLVQEHIDFLNKVTR